MCFKIHSTSLIRDSLKRDSPEDFRKIRGQEPWTYLRLREKIRDRIRDNPEVLWVPAQQVWLMTTHSAAAEFEMAKKFSKDFRTAMRTPSSRALTWAPTWYVWSAGQKPFYGQPLDRVWIRLAIKGFWTRTPDISSGGSFRSSGWGRSHGSPEILWAFFCHFKTCCRTVHMSWIRWTSQILSQPFKVVPKYLQANLVNDRPLSLVDLDDKWWIIA